jgi:uncharacterized protein YfaT (DUF1175 family)
MNDLLEQLHDIESLDPINWWPLAIGWWILIIIGVIMACALAGLAAHRLAFKRSWKNDTFQKLARLEENLSDATAAETVILLSEYLRRIALRRFSRKECAGLMGEAWLKWLAKHDPKNFDWEKKGILLIEVPYAPLSSSLSAHQIKDLIQAVRYWVR